MSDIKVKYQGIDISDLKVKSILRYDSYTKGEYYFLCSNCGVELEIIRFIGEFKGKTYMIGRCPKCNENYLCVLVIVLNKK